MNKDVFYSHTVWHHYTVIIHDLIKNIFIKDNICTVTLYKFDIYYHEFNY